MTYHGVHARRRGMTKRGAQVVGPPLRSGVWDGPQWRDTSRTCWRMIECEMNLPLKSPSGSGRIKYEHVACNLLRGVGREESIPVDGCWR